MAMSKLHGNGRNSTASYLWPEPRKGEPFGHPPRDPEEKPRKHGEELGISLAECFFKNVLAHGSRGSFEEWIPIAAGGDTKAEITATRCYKLLWTAYKKGRGSHGV